MNMKNLIKSKLFLQIFLSVLVATLATIGIVAATTTIGENISTGGTLSVTGASTLTGTINVNGMATTTASTGDFATRGLIMASSTLLVDGKTTLGNASTTVFTVSGATYLSTATLSSTLDVTGKTTLGNASTTVLTVSGGTYLATASTTDLVRMHTFTVGSGTTVSGLLYGTCAVDPQSIALATSSLVSTSCAATSVNSNYKVFVTPPSDIVSGDNWLVFEGASASTTAAGYIEIALFNASTTAAVDGPSRTWTWMAIK